MSALLAAVAIWSPAGPPATTPGTYTAAVRAVYAYSHRGGDFRARPVTRSDRDLLRRLRRGLTVRQWRRARRQLARRVRLWRFHHRIDLATPYGKWAIDPGIVECESHGSWSAYNPSGAEGPYQLLGWGAPWPVRSWRDMAAHHLIAARVWAGGAGRSNWVC